MKRELRKIPSSCSKWNATLLILLMFFTFYSGSYSGEMKTVGIFSRRNGFEDLAFIDMVRQGKLYEDSIDTAVIIQLINQGKQLLFCCFGRQLVFI